MKPNGIGTRIGNGPSQDWLKRVNARGYMDQWHKQYGTRSKIQAKTEYLETRHDKPAKRPQDKYRTLQDQDRRGVWGRARELQRFRFPDES